MSALPALVDGAIRLFGIVGDPIAQVRSPEVMTALLRAAGRNAVLVPMHVPQDQFETTMRGLMALRNLDGLVVTVPYKRRATELADLLHPTGRRVGAINALRRESDGRWSGDMFDGQGLVRALQARDVRLSGARVRMLDAGGAGSAVAVALADAGVAEIAIFDVASDRAASLAEQVRTHYPACDCCATTGPVSSDNADLLINCTPIGMAPGEGMPVPFGPLDPALMVVDVIMKPEVTLCWRMPPPAAAAA